MWITNRLWMKNIILISNRLPDKDEEVFQHFEKVTVIDSVTNPMSRQYGDKIIFFENIVSIERGSMKYFLFLSYIKVLCWYC